MIVAKVTPKDPKAQVDSGQELVHFSHKNLSRSEGLSRSSP